MSHLVSVIIPVYKVEPYLRRCIDSVINQTYTNLEIILVDDGSPDNCPAICDDYAAKDNRIIVIHKKNGGLSDARNVGLDSCKGEYLTFLDSDDWIDRSFITNLLKIAQDKQADIVLCNHKYYTDTFVNTDDIEERLYTNSEAETLLIKKYSVPFAISCGKLYHKKIFSNLRFPLGKIHEDEYTSYKAFHFANKIATTNQALYIYRQRKDSITGRDRNFDYTPIQEEQISFFYENGRIDLATYLAIKLCTIYLWRYWKDQKAINSNSIYLEKCLRLESRISCSHYGYFCQRMILKLLVHHPIFYFLYKKIY